MSRLVATIRLIGSLVWLVAMGYQFNALRIVPQDGWETDQAFLRQFGDKFQVFMTIGFVGLLQSATFIKTFFSCIGDGFNTRYDNVYVDSSGYEVRREMNGESTLMGWLMSIIIGFLLMFVMSALASPFVFCFNIYHFIEAWTRDTSWSNVFKIMAILIVCSTLVGEYFAGKWFYTQVNTVCQYQKARRVERQNMQKLINIPNIR